MSCPVRFTSQEKKARQRFAAFRHYLKGLKLPNTEYDRRMSQYMKDNFLTDIQPETIKDCSPYSRYYIRIDDGLWGPFVTTNYANLFKSKYEKVKDDPEAFCHLINEYSFKAKIQNQWAIIHNPYCVVDPFNHKYDIPSLLET